MSKSNPRHIIKNKKTASSKPCISRRDFLKYAGASAAAATAFAVAGCDQNPMGSNGKLTIASISPEQAAPGSDVTIKGSNFSANASDNTVEFGNNKAEVKSASSNKLVVQVPMGISTGKISITVTVNGLTVTASVQFTVTTGPKAINLGSGMIGALNLLYALEQTEAAFYTKVHNNPYSGITNYESLIFKGLYGHEITHRDWYHDFIGGEAKSKRIPKLHPDFSKIDFSSRHSVIKTGHLFEGNGVGAYTGVAKFFQEEPSYVTVTGKLVAVEARHVSVLNELLRPDNPKYFAEERQSDGYGVNSQGLDQVFSPEEAIDNVQPYVQEQLIASDVGK